MNEGWEADMQAMGMAALPKAGIVKRRNCFFMRSMLDRFVLFHPVGHQDKRLSLPNKRPPTYSKVRISLQTPVLQMLKFYVFHRSKRKRAVKIAPLNSSLTSFVGKSINNPENSKNCISGLWQMLKTFGLEFKSWPNDTYLSS